jgi:hypothetical protein
MIVNLPIGPRGADGLPQKQGADDFVVRFGQDAFRQLITRLITPPAPPRPLDDYRSELALARRRSVGNPGI